ncbi:MAG: glucosidase [Pseudomonadota bacterium]|nr:glucosidase [Pseudomonadota bacterium]
MQPEPSALQARLDATAEGRRMIDDEAGWRRFGPYLSDRQWGTVREDYSADGDAWAYLPHSQARSRAYRWGEDGIAGFCDEQQWLCLSLALWNGRDPILKERLFGLTNLEGNHGEDVKELYYHLDGLPSHAYMRMLYKYPQAAFPYDELLRVNAARGLDEREYELIDTGVFAEDRYFDVEIEYAKASPDHVVMRVTATNRGPDTATLHLLPQWVARNIWSWEPGVAKPRLWADGTTVVRAQHPHLPAMQLCCEGAPRLLFCDNDTNPALFGNAAGAGCFKDGIGNWLLHGADSAVSSSSEGTKAAALYRFDLVPGASRSLCVQWLPAGAKPLRDGCAAVAMRRAEADAYYAALQADIADVDRRRVQRQALAGLLWSKQFYAFDVRQWLRGDPLQPPPPAARRDESEGRDVDWGNLHAGDVMAMPDSWEYPWFAAWDLAFHCVTYTLIDPAFAKSQLLLLTQSRLMHPNGQLPAYEWKFSDTNPPVQAWAALQIYERDRLRSGVADTAFLERMFHKLMLNFAWWVNRKDDEGRNVFQGGFLGLDNIGLFDRDKMLPDGERLDQSDGTAWVASYALYLMRMALELAMRQPVYEDLATKFFEHFIYIAEAVHAACGTSPTGLWDDVDGFYYDVLRIPGAEDQVVRVRSMVGLIPLLAVEVLHDDLTNAQPAFAERLAWFLQHRPDLAALVSHFTDPNQQSLRLLALMRRDRLKRVLMRMLDEDEFLSPHGIRALSKVYDADPAVFDAPQGRLELRYAPAEGRTRDFGGNSNWRGPVWFPVNLLIIQALRTHHSYYGDEFRVEFPTRSGRLLSLREIAEALSERLVGLFLRDAAGRRPFAGDDARQQSDPHFRDHLLFHEYFDGDNGRGCGASHQTGWTAAVALLLQPGAQNAVAAAVTGGPATATTTAATDPNVAHAAETTPPSSRGPS